MLSLRNILGAPSTKIPIDGTTFVLYILPPLVCYCLAAVLAITPQTRTIRVALGPLVVLLASRATLSVDMSLGRLERRFLNVDLVVSAKIIGGRIEVPFHLALDVSCCHPWP